MEKVKTDSGTTIQEQLDKPEFVKMEGELFRSMQRTGKWGKIWIAFLVLVCMVGLFAYYIQESKSKYVTISLRDYTMWGVYISNFIFLESLSIICVLIAAILNLLHFNWYRPLARIAEITAFAAILLAGVNIVAAMGRPDRLHFVFLHGRIQSPVVWDIVIICTYLATCFLLLFVSLIPSAAACNKYFHNKSSWQKSMYRMLSFGWEGTVVQWSLLKKAVRILTIMIIPLGVIVNTIGSWLFAMNPRSQWDSANFGIYFVSGAFLLGVAGLIVIVFVIRKAYKLEHYLTDMHFDKLGKVLVLMSLIYLYFNINEYMVPGYKMDGFHDKDLQDLFSGNHAFLFWSALILGIVLPALLPLFKQMRKPVPLFIIAMVVVVAAWFKRYLIVVPGLLHPYLPIQDVPKSWQNYFPSWVELSVVSATIAAMLLIITLFTKYFPVISVWEVAEGNIDQKNEMINYEN